MLLHGKTRIRGEQSERRVPSMVCNDCALGVRVSPALVCVLAAGGGRPTNWRRCCVFASHRHGAHEIRRVCDDEIKWLRDERVWRLRDNH